LTIPGRYVYLRRAVSANAPDLSDPARLTGAYAEHAPSMRAAARAVLADPAAAEDVVQDVFLWLWRHPDRYDTGRGPLGTYLRVLARSRAVDHWRAQRSRGRGTDRPLDDAAARVAGDEDVAIAVIARDGLSSVVRRAVRRLPPEQRDAILLAFWRDLTREEIADARRVPVGTAKSRVRLALIHLRQDARLADAVVA
jgi:RNA polymerase sigma-70 factor, ECF subfamily